MEKTSPSKTHSVLILKADQLYAETLRRLTLAVLPHAAIRIALSVESASQALAEESVDLLVTGVGASLGGDVLELLSDALEAPVHVRHVLVVTTNREHRQLAVLRQLTVQGVFDSASEAPENFKTALDLVMTGNAYWSRSLLDQLHQYSSEPNSTSRVLTDSEHLVLSVIGDGSDDVEAGTKLGLSAATVATVRRNIHRKLGIQHRGALVRIAAQNGYVRFTPSGVVRPGLAMLEAACRHRHRGRASGVAV